jgi:integrase
MFVYEHSRPALTLGCERADQVGLPVVLSRDEVARLLNATTCLKHQAALSVAYGAGLRVAEVSTLKVADVDSERMLLRVERGKGGRYRNAMLSEDLLALLREWWKAGRQQGVMHRDGWLFPGQHAMKPISTRQLYRIVVEAAQAADIAKRVGPAHSAPQLRDPPSGGRHRHPTVQCSLYATSNSSFNWWIRLLNGTWGTCSSEAQPIKPPRDGSSVRR